MEKHDNYLHSALTGEILGRAYEVFNELGFGFLESVYEKSLEQILIENGHTVLRQSAITVFFRGEQVGNFRADLIVDGKVIIELKAAQSLHPIHEAQLINYLKATEIEVGLLINFGEELEVKRRVFSNGRKKRLGGF